VRTALDGAQAKSLSLVEAFDSFDDEQVLT
jgi:hypothetical protein